MSQPTLPVIWATIQDVVQTAGGIPAIWAFQSASQPPTDYCRISLGAYATEGFDYTQEMAVPDWLPSTHYAVADRVINDGGKTYTCTTAGTSAIADGPHGMGSGIADGSCVWNYVAPGGEVAITVGGVRNVALQIEVWSSSLIDQVAQPTALSTCDAIVTRLRLPLARQALAAVGVAPWAPGPTQWIPSIVSIGFRGRATCDYMCRMPARALQEFAAYIASVTVGVDVGSGITATVTAP